MVLETDGGITKLVQPISQINVTPLGEKFDLCCLDCYIATVILVLVDLMVFAISDTWVNNSCSSMNWLLILNGKLYTYN